MLKDVVNFDSESCVADHLWFTMGKQFERLGLKKGDTLAFNARVTMYEKGYTNCLALFFEPAALIMFNK